MAALRTAKIDLMQSIRWQDADNLMKANPQLLEISSPVNGSALWLMVDKKPFDDIRVRQAMQMAINLPELASTYYGGYVAGTPVGCVGNLGYFVPFAEWPQALKDTYTYNPTGAKQLLAAAGYPNGFTASCINGTDRDVDLAQIIKSYEQAIGVTLNIVPMDPAAALAYERAGKHETCMQNGWLGAFPPLPALRTYYSQHWYTTMNHVNDPAYDALYLKCVADLTDADTMADVKAADMYGITKQWKVMLTPDVTSSVYWPWLHNFQGEETTRFPYWDVPYLWIDQNLKSSMGY